MLVERLRLLFQAMSALIGTKITLNRHLVDCCRRSYSAAESTNSRTGSHTTVQHGDGQAVRALTGSVKESSPTRMILSNVLQQSTLSIAADRVYRQR